MISPYAAAPLSDEQRAEVLRVTSECAASERHNYRTMLDGERAAALSAAKSDPGRAAEHRAQAQAYERASTLLAQCWPNPAL